MAVQSQYQSPCTQQSSFLDLHTTNMFGGYNFVGQPILNGTVVFSEPTSELTCNMSASKKRNRDGFIPQPQGTSTSSRSPFLVSSHSQDLKSNLLLQNLEIDALIQLQNEKLRAGLEEMRKRHCASLMSVLEHQFLKKLEEKETEIANANRRNAELEEKIKQMSSENQIWFNVAKNNEAMVFSLKTSLEQIILQNQSQNQIKEGFGDSDDQSCCNVDDNSNGVCIAQERLRENREIYERRRCKACHDNEISVLALPCRHLCLCKQCESKIESCPTCNSSINGSLQIFMS